MDGLSVKITQLLDTTLRSYNHVVIDKDCAATDGLNLKFEDSNRARRIYAEMSKHGLCVFFLSEVGMMFFVDGNDFGDAIFCTESDIKTYIKKKDISEIEQVIEEYRAKLREQSTYSKFFVYKTTLKHIYPPSKREQGKNLLRNKPENTFRNDLLTFLKSNIKGSFVFAKEFILESLNRFDIWTYDENGNWIIIEVKWIGQSIHPGDRKEGVSFGPEHIKKKAVPQVLGYIQEAILELKYGVKAGYLVVYDARSSKDGDSLDTTDYTYVEADLHKFIPLFHKFPDLAVDNIQPN
jgi:hypothetical protein